MKSLANCTTCSNTVSLGGVVNDDWGRVIVTKYSRKTCRLIHIGRPSWWARISASSAGIWKEDPMTLA
ncbi:MAG: hypothetical protein H7A01_11950 [Hahellaceae bacterium]|nr:hypothetical protein [Hahellaceae bacterium]